MFKKELNEWNRAISKYDKKSKEIVKKIKINLKKKKLSKEESKKLLNAFVKFFDVAEEKVNKAINHLDNLVATYDDMLNV